MELNVRDWLIILGGLVAAGFVLDAYRRVRAGYSDKLRMSAKQRDEEDLELNNPELPAGGARVVSRSKAVPSYELQDSDGRTDSDGPVPVLMDSVEPEPEVNDPAPVEKPSAKQSLGELAETPTAENLKAAPAESEVSPETVAKTAKTEKAGSAASKTEPESTPDLKSRSKTEPAASKKHAPENKRKADEKKAEKTVPEEIIVLHVVAPESGALAGGPLLQILLACDVRFGRMNIFHRYEEAGGEGAEQFSVVNMVAPGTFDLDAMENFSTPGISFFMSLPGPKDPIKAFDCMVETAQVVVKNLRGELHDEAHSVCTTQTIEHLRQRIRDFERRQLTLV